MSALMSSRARRARLRYARGLLSMWVVGWLLLPAFGFAGEEDDAARARPAVHTPRQAPLRPAVRTQEARPPKAEAGDAAPEQASTQDAAPKAAPEQVEVRLMVIEATNSKVGFDPKVEKFRPQLAFLSYKGFDLLMEEKISLKMGETKTVGLFEGKTLEATLVSGTNSRVNIRLRLRGSGANSPATLDTTVSVPRKGTFFVGGPKHHEGVLILPVTAWY